MKIGARLFSRLAWNELTSHRQYLCRLAFAIGSELGNSRYCNGSTLCACLEKKKITIIWEVDGLGRGLSKTTHVRLRPPFVPPIAVSRAPINKDPTGPISFICATVKPKRCIISANLILHSNYFILSSRQLFLILLLEIALCRLFIQLIFQYFVSLRKEVKCLCLEINIL